MRWYRWLVVTAVVSAIAAGAFVVFRGDAEPAEATGPLLVASGEGGEAAPVPRPVGRYNAPTGIQTTVPDTLGYPQRTAIYALENGGFRVRVMEHAVTAAGEEGLVVAQLPRGGVTRRLGWIVTIYIGRLR